MAQSDDERPTFVFDRYINGRLMAEGVTIERSMTLEAAMSAAARLASRGPNRETPVLVYVPHAPRLEVPADDKLDDLIGRLIPEDCRCPFCGRDPYEYVDVGVGFVPVAVTCCDLGASLIQDRDEQLVAVVALRREAAETIITLLASLASAADRIERLEAALAWFHRQRKSIESDVRSAHRCRGNGASEWMTEDDRDFRRDLSEALDRLDALFGDPS